jgi:CxxC-x17-CxxC domain-containing protein
VWAALSKGDSPDQDRQEQPMPESQAQTFEDRSLKCIDCGGSFIFTAGEQSFFHDKNFKNEPKRCRNCKQKRQGAMSTGNHGGRVETSTNCSQCGCETTVPFRPTQGRPVFCRECFQGHKGEAHAAASA